MNGEQTKLTDQFPFGLRYATDPDPATAVHIDWSVIGYDPVRQVATVTENGVTMPLRRSFSASTHQSTHMSTSTQMSYPDGGSGSDSDSNSDSNYD
ncbi:putative ATP-grasp-modified RiPP [Streptomyces sp. 3N207]|uniref:putative ATP-grasp-modified RiPP n=1 Tax=Streptomyces sp. 3N207 TaxID=3457417 RepID=UPI003FD06EDF